MEHLVSFLTLRERKTFASVCRTFNAIHKEAPFSSANITSRNKAFAKRAKKVIVDECIGDLESFSCQELLIWDIICEPVIDKLVVPNVKIVRYSGNFQQFANLTLPKRLDILDVYAYEYLLSRDHVYSFAFKVKTLKTLTLGHFLKTIADRYEITTGDYEQYKEQLPQDATICFHGTLSFTYVTKVLHTKIEVHGCCLQTIQYCRPLESLVIRQSNAILSDLPNLSQVHSLDLMDNDTLKQGPDVQGLRSLNLLHTGIRDQVSYALRVLGNVCSYVGLTLANAELHRLPDLFQKRIELLEVCCESSLCFPVHPNIGELRIHTPHYFSRSFTRRHCTYFIHKRG
jgi:hypothetical protein